MSNRDADDNYIERRANSVTRAEFTELKTNVESVKVALVENTEMTKDIKALLYSFKIMMHIGKWLSVIALTFTATVAAVKSGMGIFK